MSRDIAFCLHKDNPLNVGVAVGEAPDGALVTIWQDLTVRVYDRTELRSITSNENGVAAELLGYWTASLLSHALGVDDKVNATVNEGVERLVTRHLTGATGCTGTLYCDECNEGFSPHGEVI